jgi:hypothetical protein
MSDDGKTILKNLGLIALVTLFPPAAIIILLCVIFS